MHWQLWLLQEIADLCRLMGRYDEARSHLDHALEIAPFDASCYGFMADLLRQQQKSDEAIGYLRKAVELDEHYAWAWRELAELKAIKHEHQAADEAYEQACRCEPEEAINDGLRAFLLRQRDQREHSQHYLERAVKRQPEYVWAWRELVDLHLTMQRPAEALRTAEQAIEAIPNNVGLLTQYIDCLRANNDSDKARELAEQIAEVHPKHLPLLALRTELAIAQRSPEAISLSQTLCQLDNDVDAHCLHVQAPATSN